MLYESSFAGADGMNALELKESSELTVNGLWTEPRPEG